MTTRGVGRCPQRPTRFFVPGAAGAEGPRRPRGDHEESFPKERSLVTALSTVTATSIGTPAAAVLAGAARFLAADWKYWLPPNYSEHGGSMDMLFNWIFWITTIIFFIVEITLLVFLVKYRQRNDGRRAIFTHGNTRLEMAWTLAPAVILIILALATKRVWDGYRYSKDANDPGRAQVLVVGEQFKWNFVFPGPDGKLGTYLAYPKPADAKYRGMS